MSDWVIRTEDLGKKYRIWQNNKKPQSSLRDIFGGARHMFVDAPAKELIHGSLVPEIAAHDRRSAELQAQRLGPLLPLVVMDHDPAALAEELPRACASDSARGARD